MIKGLAHICLSATDLTAVERFYCEALACHKVFDFIRNGKVVGFYLAVSQGSSIEVFEQKEIDPDASGLIRHFCLEVEDIDQVRLRLLKGGYEATEKKLGADHSWQLWTTDPSGVRIEFHQYTEQSSQITGQNCVLE
jgi:catechol 2,3-dioxygenase-like lactoylglutathione lyase family enzyme